MKKILTITLTLLLVLCLFGCGGKKTVKGKWYYEDEDITVVITDKKFTISDSAGNSEELGITIFEDELQIDDNAGSFGYRLSEDGNTLVLTLDGISITFERK